MMIRPLLSLAGALAFMVGPALADPLVIPIHRVDVAGIGPAVGTITVTEGAGGLVLAPRLSGLPAGPHGFHLHQNPSCAPATGPDGQPGAALAAGGHYDPAATASHRGPHRPGHLGDLPVLVVAADGTATAPLMAPRLRLADLRGRAVVIHAGGDTYSDQPAPLGGGGPRIACGVVSPPP